jgi:subtilisin-like proprotein convertase family protein
MQAGTFPFAISDLKVVINITHTNLADLEVA